MQDRIKEHDREIRLSHTQTSTVSEHANETGHLLVWKEVKFVDRDPHWYTRSVKEAIHIRLHPNNINRDSRNNNEDRNAPIVANQHATNSNT